MSSLEKYFPLQWKNVTLTFNDFTCLNNISFTIEAKGLTQIMGINGSGKTLLLKLCAGLLKPSSGSILWQQEPVAPKFTLVPQRPSLLDNTVEKNILLPLEKNGISHAQEKCHQAMEWAGIFSLKDKSSLKLSTGETQLVSLARAWALEPEIMLLDEPSANLDPSKKQEMDNLIQEMSKNCKIIMSTHSLQQAKALADDIIMLEEGKLVFQGSTENFFESSAFQRYMGNV
jgi:tungstate transport system ATP-binding protein